MAIELSYGNVPWNEIVPAMVDRGCPRGIAEQIAILTEAFRKRDVRQAATKLLGRSVLSLALGGVLALLFWGWGLVTIASMLLLPNGVINLPRALFYGASGRVPLEQADAQKYREWRRDQRRRRRIRAARPRRSLRESVSLGIVLWVTAIGLGERVPR